MKIELQVESFHAFLVVLLVVAAPSWSLLRAIVLTIVIIHCFRPRRKTKTLIKKDKYPLAPGLLSNDPNRPAVQQVTRDMYNMSNGYMPNGDYSDYG